MKSLGIFGTSGFARETRDVAAELGYRVTFIAASEAGANSLESSDLVVLESELPRASGMVFAIGIGDNAARRRVWQAHRDSLQFVNLVHPSATFGHGQRARVDAALGVIICAGARLMSGISLGNFVVCSLNTTIGHDVTAEDFVMIAPGANISGHVHLGSGTWIGTGATVIQGRPGAPLRIGSRSTIGAGAVVIRDCDADATYAGVPARRIR